MMKTSSEKYRERENEENGWKVPKTTGRFLKPVNWFGPVSQRSLKTRDQSMPP